jgi:hypothetical protein
MHGAFLFITPHASFCAKEFLPHKPHHSCDLLLFYNTIPLKQYPVPAGSYRSASAVAPVFKKAIPGPLIADAKNIIDYTPDLFQLPDTSFSQFFLWGRIPHGQGKQYFSNRKTLRIWDIERSLGSSL